MKKLNIVLIIYGLIFFSCRNSDSKTDKGIALINKSPENHSVVVKPISGDSSEVLTVRERPCGKPLTIYTGDTVYFIKHDLPETGYDGPAYELIGRK